MTVVYSENHTKLINVQWKKTKSSKSQSRWYIHLYYSALKVVERKKFNLKINVANAVTYARLAL
jgi:hypothetical protein